MNSRRNKLTGDASRVWLRKTETKSAMGLTTLFDELTGASRHPSNGDNPAIIPETTTTSI
jgi:hypothetical protein